MTTFTGAPTRSEIFDPGYLLSGLFSIAKFERYLKRYLPINDFERLAKPVFVTAVDIDNGRRHVFGPGYDTTTPVSEAVAASCCVPGLFRPFRIRDKYYVDGEVARTLSADIAVEAGADVVIISNIYQPVHQFDAPRSIARQGVQRVLRQSISILLTEKERRGVELLHERHPHVRFIDIAPDLGAYGYLNRFAVRPLVMRGYGTGLRALAAAKEAGQLNTSLPPNSNRGALPSALQGAPPSSPSNELGSVAE
jgi:NTE family protein